MRSHHVARAVLAITIITLAGCSVLQPDAHLAAFGTPMNGLNQVPWVATSAAGRIDAVLNKNTHLLRWKLSYKGLSGPATAAHFHGPAAAGANAKVALALKGPLKSPLEGRATLTPAQASDLLAGKWYVSLHTEAHPDGEIRGQMYLWE